MGMRIVGPSIEIPFSENFSEIFSPTTNLNFSMFSSTKFMTMGAWLPLIGTKIDSILLIRASIAFSVASIRGYEPIM